VLPDSRYVDHIAVGVGTESKIEPRSLAMSKKLETPGLEKILVKDDASRYLESLPDKQRWPQYGLNGLPEEGPPPTAQEREALRAIWLPK
jgi:hypothetical protein